MSLAGSPVRPHAATFSRSLRLFRAFLHEQDDPDRFYSTLASDTVSQLSQWTALAGTRVLDVGGGPGYFADAFAAAGARYAGVEPDAGEMTARGDVAGDSLRASGLELPIAAGAFDLTLSSNVLEHVPEPERMADEMVRVTRPGGLVYLSWTPWLSPWGGHETAPWHYLGGRRAGDRYARRHGHRPKNDFGHSLFACSASRMVRWAQVRAACGLIDPPTVLPRYHPDWAHWMARVPGVREVAAWNVVLVIRPTAPVIGG
ncbi:MAG: class I SAM-dependent methyltransferase [Dermatophilaceae bacterium]